MKLADSGSSLKKFVERGNGLEGDTTFPATLKDPPLLLTGGRGDGDKDFLNLPRPAQMGKLLDRPHYLNCVDSPPLFPEVVINEPYYLIVQRQIPADLPQQHLPCVAGSHDEGTPPDGPPILPA